MTKTIASATDSSKRYFLTIDEQTGHATDCQCPDRQYRHHECKHMRNFNAEVQRAAMFMLLRQRFDSRLNGDEETRRCYRDLANCY
jgi:hypothetical protein